MIKLRAKAKKPAPTGKIRVQWWSDTCVRITHLKPDHSEYPEDKPWLREVFSVPSSMKSENPEYQLDTLGGSVCILSQNRQVLFELAKPVQFLPKNKCELRIKTEQAESFYGWGEWFDAFERHSGSFTLTNRESPAITQGFQTYSTIPLYWSSRGYAFFLLDSAASAWEFHSSAGELQARTSGSCLDYLIFLAETPKQFLTEYTRLTGRPPLIPRWGFGLWLTSYPQDTQDKVVDIVQQHRDHQIPLDAVILDYHWEEKFHNFQWRKTLIPDSDQMISSLSKLGVKTGLIFTPFQNNSNQPLKKGLLNLLVSNVSPGTARDDERALSEYAYAKIHNYFAHNQTAWWFGSGGMVDFTNPDACSWWNKLLTPLYQQGVAFFKNDDGEYLPSAAVSSLGIPGPEHHNLYGFFYGRAIYEGMQELDDRRGLVYSRCVWAGSQRYPALFLGDQKPTFVDIRRTLRAALNLSMAGFAYWTADTFGLDGLTTPETHMRYAQWGLFSPIARYFLRPPSIDNTRLPWSHSARTEASFRRHVELRYRLIPYFSTLAWQAYRSGIPMFRPMLLEYPSDPKFSAVDDQFMYGSQLLFAPVTEKGVVTRSVRFPAGNWFSWWTDDRISGGKEQEIPAPLDYLPIFVRGGSILPLSPVFQSLSQEYALNELEIHFWPPFENSFDLYEDDGLTRSYQDDQYTITNISAVRNAAGFTIAIAPAQGDFPGFPSQREVKFVIHQIDDFSEIKIGRKLQEVFTYNRMSRLLTIRVKLDTRKGVKLTIKNQD